MYFKITPKPHLNKIERLFKFLKSQNQEYFLFKYTKNNQKNYIFYIFLFADTH